MPSSPTSPAVPAVADPSPVPSAPRWWHEPLLHFVLLGALIFALDAWWFEADDDLRTIVIDAEVDKQALDVFRKARGREPNEDELYALRRVWLDNEVLYREGVALQMDRGDPAIKDRVIFKALSMINAGLKLPPIDDAKLRAWFEQNRVKYDEPARLDFQEAVLAGEPTEEAARSFAAELNAGTPGEARAGLRVFKDRPQPTIVQSYGEAFSQALAAAPPGQWQALAQGQTWRVIRLERLTPARPASFESLRNVVLQDWKDTVMADQRTAAVRELAKKYTVKVEATQP